MKKSRKVVAWTLAMVGVFMLMGVDGAYGFALAFGGLALIVAGAAIGKAFYWQEGGER